MKIPVEEQYKFVKLTLPDGSKAEGMSVLLHALSVHPVHRLL